MATSAGLSHAEKPRALSTAIVSPGSETLKEAADAKNGASTVLAPTARKDTLVMLMPGWWLPLLSVLAQSASRLQLWQAQQLSDALTLIRGGPEAKSQLFAGRKEALLHLKHFAAHLEPQVGGPFLRLPLEHLA